MTDWKYCPQCATELALLVAEEDSGPVERLRCPVCGFTHWNNPVPVLAAIVAIRTFLSWSLALELDGRWPWQRPTLTHQP